MTIHNTGFHIPGAITSTEFARKPSTHLQVAIETGNPLLIIKRNVVLAAIVPVTTRGDFERYLRTDANSAEGE